MVPSGARGTAPGASAPPLVSSSNNRGAVGGSRCSRQPSGAAVGAALSSNESVEFECRLLRCRTRPRDTFPVRSPRRSSLRSLRPCCPLSSTFRRRSPPESGTTTEQAAGTGMIVTASGEVLTNNHVSTCNLDKGNYSRSFGQL